MRGPVDSKFAVNMSDEIAPEPEAEQRIKTLADLVRVMRQQATFIDKNEERITKLELRQQCLIRALGEFIQAVASTFDDPEALKLAEETREELLRMAKSIRD